ncbi:MAG: hypothetical protein EOP61_01325 [Sphingomonadales bacterium]|nr:MAG: hypothetical protein EOP61_01325 [Sphingomonadales bacterium]
MAGAQDDWWVIGSAAAVLHGASLGEIADIDVMLSVADARRILPGLGVALTPGVADQRFRSEFYCQWTSPPVPVDFMAGFTAHGAPLVPATREAITIGEQILFVPAKDELIAILQFFGRPKDLERARLLEAWRIGLSSSSPASP